MSDLEKAVAKLEARTTELRKLLVYAPRPFVIEFAGTPKSGKSTSVESIRHFLSRQEFRVHVLTERAELCPIPMKGHLFFNTWCAASMLAELLANVETVTDIIIVDRGLFDALIWLSQQEKRGELIPEEARTLEKFLLLKRWRSLIDVVIVMSVSPAEALSRENAQHITQKGGSIMKPEVLDAINTAVSYAIGQYKDQFPAIINHQTTGYSVRESNVALTERLLDHLKQFLDPEILVVPRARIEALPLERGEAFGREAMGRALDCISSNGSFVHRAAAEEDPNYVQIIPCGMLMHNDMVFLFQRKEKDPKYRLYGKTTIWQGCHVVKQDESDIPALLETALLGRISGSLFLSQVFPIESLGYCWDRENPESSRHFGVVYRINIDNPDTAADLKKKEFRRGRGHGLSGEFNTLKETSDKRENLGLESWSMAILDHMVH